MYDTIKVFVKDAELQDRVLDRLSKRNKGVSEMKGNYEGGVLGDNMLISQGESGVMVQGSLSKYYIRSNAKTLQRIDVENAIDKLSNELEIDVGCGVCMRVDVGLNIPTRKEPKYYFNCLGELTGYQRLNVHKYTLSYEREDVKLVMYDKVRELRDKKQREWLKQMMMNDKVLRVEWRLLKPKKHFENGLYACDLYNEQMYCKLVKELYDCFIKIKTMSTMDGIKVDNVKDAVALFVARYTTPAEAAEFINLLKSGNVFSDPKYLSRAKQTISKMQGISTGKRVDVCEDYDELATYIAHCTKLAR